MANLKQLRLRLRGIKATQKITEAMQMIAASKLKKYKHALALAELYPIEATELLNRALNMLSKEDNLLNEEGGKLLNKIKVDQARAFLFIVITSERGLCGGFNNSLLRSVVRDINQCQGQNIKIAVVGKRGYDYLKLRYSEISITYYDSAVDLDQILYLAKGIKSLIWSCLSEYESLSCNLYFNKFKNSLTQVPTSKKILPIDFQENWSCELRSSDLKEQEDIESSGRALEGENIFEEILERYVVSVLYYSLISSIAGEQGARMVAMDNATRNAAKIIDNLTLELNRLRQASITKELMEIISGAEAV